eukprot:3933630-Rhodomonas_salina.3
MESVVCILECGVRRVEERGCRVEESGWRKESGPRSGMGRRGNLAGVEVLVVFGDHPGLEGREEDRGREPT